MLTTKNAPARQEQPAQAGINEQPALSAARAKLANLHAQHTTARLAVLAIEDQLSAATAVENEAQALLDGKPHDVGGIKSQLAEAQRKCAVVIAAIGLQNQAIDTLHRQSCQEYCRDVAGPEHQRLIREIIEALEVLGARIDAESRFIDRLRADDVLLCHPVAPLHMPLGRPSDAYSNFSLSLKEARAAL